MNLEPDGSVGKKGAREVLREKPPSDLALKKRWKRNRSATGAERDMSEEDWDF